MSVDLTQLPAAHRSVSQGQSDTPAVEYSSREVAPGQLLLQQLQQAHSIFLLHHATTLSDLFVRLSRDTFCDLLDRFWSRFIWNWDVLLHGNPAVDIYNGVKLASGGELGIGVGEEEWGSGEREVLEDFVSRTDGLVDLVVSRFGDAPQEQDSSQKTGSLEKPQFRTPWLGTDADPRSSDGVIFSGIAAVSRRSVATLSQWMEWIYRYGDRAYGVGENPSSRRHRPRSRSPARKAEKIGTVSAPDSAPMSKAVAPKPRHSDDLRRQAMGNSAGHAKIPPPLVVGVEKAVEVAKPPSNPPSVPFTKRKQGLEQTPATPEDSSMFGTENMMKVLRLGYGSVWTLSPDGLSKSESTKPTSQEESVRPKVGNGEIKRPSNGQAPVETPSPRPLQEVEPTPEVSDSEEKPFVQRLEQSIGKFIIGLSGDLEASELSEPDGEDVTDDSANHASQGRIFLRTLAVEMSTSWASLRASSQKDEEEVRAPRGDHSLRTGTSSLGSHAASKHFQKLQVAIYVHQPFIFAFLFTLHTPTLSMTSFYRSIHHQLGPLQKPLLRSTNPEQIAERIAIAIATRTSTTTPTADSKPEVRETNDIYDVIYDPDKLSIRTSLPNIPPPGSLSAEGFTSSSRKSITVSGSWYTLGIPISSSDSSAGGVGRDTLKKGHWTRIDAINVHTQILNTYMNTHHERQDDGRLDRERTVKTGRGWWVLFMRVPSITNYGIDSDKEAFLVRKALGSSADAKKKEIASGSSGSRWLLREQTRDVSGSSTGSRQGSNTVAGINEGVGVDARKWVEGLLSLSR